MISRMEMLDKTQRVMDSWMLILGICLKPIPNQKEKSLISQLLTQHRIPSDQIPHKNNRIKTKLRIDWAIFRVRDMESNKKARKINKTEDRHLRTIKT